MKVWLMIEKMKMKLRIFVLGAFNSGNDSLARSCIENTISFYYFMDIWIGQLLVKENQKLGGAFL